MSIRRRRLKREAEEKVNREKHRRLQEIELAKIAEEKFRSNLMRNAEMWQRVDLLRSFVSICEKELCSVAGPVKRAAEWLAWARAYADLIDPLKSGFLQIELARFNKAIPSINPDI